MKQSKMIAAKRIAVAVAAVCATMSAPAFAADDVKNLLDLLLKKGVITQAEYDTYVKSDAFENQQDRTNCQQRCQQARKGTRANVLARNHGVGLHGREDRQCKRQKRCTDQGVVKFHNDLFGQAQ